jgi:hypothetical protein
MSDERTWEEGAAYCENVTSRVNDDLRLALNALARWALHDFTPGSGEHSRECGEYTPDRTRTCGYPTHKHPLNPKLGRFALRAIELAGRDQFSTIRHEPTCALGTQRYYDSHEDDGNQGGLGGHDEERQGLRGEERGLQDRGDVDDHGRGKRGEWLDSLYRALSGCFGGLMAAKKKASGRNIPEAQRGTGQVKLRLPPDVKDDLDDLAARWGLTVSGTVAVLVERATQSNSPDTKEGNG